MATRAANSPTATEPAAPPAASSVAPSVAPSVARPVASRRHVQADGGSAGAAAADGCNRNYTPCVPDDPVDVDCAGGSGNGPSYVTGPVRVIGADVYGLDADGNGIGCEAGAGASQAAASQTSPPPAPASAAPSKTRGTPPSTTTAAPRATQVVPATHAPAVDSRSAPFRSDSGMAVTKP